METVFDYIFTFLTTYFLPQETALEGWHSILIIICTIVTIGIFWAWIVRPFWWFFKYGIWGGSKKQRRLNNWDD